MSKDKGNVSAGKWRKSPRSNGAGGNCVEVAVLDASIGVRDSKAPHTGHLTFVPGAWSAFMTDVKAGRHDT
ncbi:DUF397 domain-containing protein [Actinomadura sp. BRA 177]|uniref:DUF397 domain-containing protein n=1 Tax=Actinomadura sp. BRA 177 TaxID=2745202 RepID=UPI00159617F3|nr:DUF397 domain-containing protein [Actinomadura sp. BRA 177]NVI90600.1 DUF397 domain-containing protein [Actinomadura sp. BRA 177]